MPSVSCFFCPLHRVSRPSKTAFIGGSSAFLVRQKFHVRATRPLLASAAAAPATARSDDQPASLSSLQRRKPLSIKPITLLTASNTSFNPTFGQAPREKASFWREAPKKNAWEDRAILGISSNLDAVDLSSRKSSLEPAVPSASPSPSTSNSSSSSSLDGSSQISKLFGVLPSMDAPGAPARFKWAPTPKPPQLFRFVAKPNSLAASKLQPVEPKSPSLSELLLGPKGAWKAEAPKLGTKSAPPVAQVPPKKRVEKVLRLSDTMTPRALSKALGVRVMDIVQMLRELGELETKQVDVEDLPLSVDAAELTAIEFGYSVIRDGSAREDAPRPPVITVMGHVDHGKTTLLDALRNANVAGAEVGGITQRIGAFSVKTSANRLLTFIDTPGHAAFSSMRARGTKITDIVVVVISATDGLQPQTLESISLAKEAGAPLIIAINKIDRADDTAIRRIKQELSSHDVVIEEFGGEVQCVEISAKQRLNLDRLEEAILLQADLMDLRTVNRGRAEAYVLETRIDKHLGSVASLIVVRGRLQVGDSVVVGTEYGKVRSMLNDAGQRVSEALPGAAVEIQGLKGVPNPGQRVVVVEDEDKAKKLSDRRKSKETLEDLKSALSIEYPAAPEKIRRKRNRSGHLLPNVVLALQQQEAQLKLDKGREVQQAEDKRQNEIFVLIKADVRGSYEAIRTLVQQVEDQHEVPINVVGTGLGAVTESDVERAATTGAVIMAFNCAPTAAVRELARTSNVVMRLHRVVYDLADDLICMSEDINAEADKYVKTGEAEIRNLIPIKIKKEIKMIAGCQITDGTIKDSGRVTIKRQGETIAEGVPITSLRRFKEIVPEVNKGLECGIGLDCRQMQVGDVIQLWETRPLKKKWPERLKSKTSNMES